MLEGRPPPHNPLYQPSDRGSADTSPVILIESRERTPLKFDHPASQTATLQSGDYSVLGAQELFAGREKIIQATHRHWRKTYYGFFPAGGGSGGAGVFLIKV